MRPARGTLLLCALQVACEPAKPADSASESAPPLDSAPPDSTADSEEPGESGESGGLDSVPGTGHTAEPHVEEEVVESYPTEFEHLPVLLIEAYERVGDGEKAAGWMELVREHDGTLTDLDDAPRAWAGDIGIEIHGASSSVDPKHNYRLELRDDAGEDIDYPLLGLGADSDYVLHASYGDKTYLRNAFAYAIARSLAEDTGEWHPGTAYAEVFLNDTYLGIYAVTERIKRDGDRLDLPTPAASEAEGDLSGGYVFKVDYDRGDYFATARGTLIEPIDPDDDEYSLEQNVYVRSWFDDFEAMMGGADYADETTGYPAWLDVDAWVDFILVNELAHNIDAYRLSTYHYKEAAPDGGLFHAGPVWDFDRAFGNVNYCWCYETDGWVIDDLIACGVEYQFPFWWQRLLADEAFQDRLACRWEELRAGKLSDETMVATMEALAAEVAEAEPRDHELWGTLGVNVGFNYYVGETWEDELDWFRDWTLERAAWMDANIWGSCE